MDAVGQVAKTYPGQNGTVDDDVTLGRQGTAGCLLDIRQMGQQIRVRSLTINAAYNRLLSIVQGSTLYVNGVQSGNTFTRGSFTLQSGQIEVGGGLVLEQATGEWSNATIDSGPAQAQGTFSVTKASILNISADANTLGDHLSIGGDEGTDISQVTVGAMNRNLTAAHNAKIVIYTNGQLNFDQTQDSDTKGGIVKAANSADSTIENHGKIHRSHADDQDGNRSRAGVASRSAFDYRSARHGCTPARLA